MKSNGSCFRDALEAAGIAIPPDLSIPNWVNIEEVPHICKNLGLKWHGTGEIKLGIEPVIICFCTSENKGHAIFTEDVGPFLDYNIIGLIRFCGKETLKNEE